MPKPPKQRRGANAPPIRLDYYELEVIPGLAPFAQAELKERCGDDVHRLPNERPDRVRFQFDGPPAMLLPLRRSVAVHRVRHLNIPRPKALLGHQYFELLVELLQIPLGLYPGPSFQTFNVSAAGSGSSVFTRIKTNIERRLGLTWDEETGDLAIAVRRPQRLSAATRKGSRGWEVAVRLSPRPLATRPWRVCDMPGALNGTVASTMMSLAQPAAQDCVVNLACGSGTLLIERLALGQVRRAIGCDIDPQALNCARQNLAASGRCDTVSLIRCDAGRVPLPNACTSTVCADLPFGMLVGSHEGNETLYPRLVSEAGRLVAGGGWLVVITQEVRLFERVIAAQAKFWKVAQVIPIKLPANTRSGYIRPRIYVCRRTVGGRAAANA